MIDLSNSINNIINNHTIPYKNCTTGVNGDLPTEITYCDLTETYDLLIETNKNKLIDAKSYVALAIMSPNLLNKLKQMHALFFYNEFGAIDTLFKNEIGFCENIRIIISPEIMAIDYGKTSILNNPVYPTYLFLWINGKENSGNVIDLRSTII